MVETERGKGNVKPHQSRSDGIGTPLATWPAAERRWRQSLADDVSD